MHPSSMNYKLELNSKGHNTRVVVPEKEKENNALHKQDVGKKIKKTKKMTNPLHATNKPPTEVISAPLSQEVGAHGSGGCETTKSLILMPQEVGAFKVDG